MAREFAKSFYKSKDWQDTRELIMKRDNYLCQKCGSPAEEVHHKIHLSPSNIGDVSITLNPDNLVSLCRDCHFAEHREDKLKGLKEYNQKADCAEEYEFDESGMLVRCSIPPGLKKGT